MRVKDYLQNSRTLQHRRRLSKALIPALDKSEIMEDESESKTATSRFSTDGIVHFKSEEPTVKNANKKPAQDFLKSSVE